MPRRIPIVALLTDYGLSDHYVGVIKSVLLDILPTVRIIDINHDISPGSIREGAYALWATAPYLPAGTTVLAVVDPGVGTDRRIVMLQALGSSWIAPDNGLLDLVRGEDPKAKAFMPKHAVLRRIVRDDVSTTFHGRDIFAPLAAAVASGRRLSQLGTPVALTPVAGWRASSTEPASIMTIDRFGNIVTNIEIPQGREPRDVVRMVGVGNIMVSRSIRTYHEATENAPCMIRGSSGLLEVVVRNGSASRLLRAHEQSPVRVMWL